MTNEEREDIKRYNIVCSECGKIAKNKDFLLLFGGEEW